MNKFDNYYEKIKGETLTEAKKVNMSKVQKELEMAYKTFGNVIEKYKSELYKHLKNRDDLPDNLEKSLDARIKKSVDFDIDFMNFLRFLSSESKKHDK